MTARARKAKRISETPPPPPPTVEGLVWAAHAQQQSVNWLWPGALPCGALVLVEGRKATGKSTVLASLVASLTGGPVVPGWTGPRDGRAVWIASEDSWESVVVPRLAAASADLSRVGRVQLTECMGRTRRMVLPDDTVILQDCLRESGARLLVLDPYVSLAHPALDVRVEQQARAYLEPLADVCNSLNVTCCMARHLRKGQGGDAREAGLGSVAVSNVARVVLRCDEHPHERGAMVLSTVACNWGRRGPTQIYSFRDTPSGYPVIAWEGVSALDAESIAEGRGTAAERDEWSDADHLLLAMIRDGWCQVLEILKEADAAGITPRILRRAKERLGVQSRRTRFAGVGSWQWGRPKAGWPPNLAEEDGEEGGTCGRGRLGAPSPEKPPENPGKPAKTPRRPRPHVPPPQDAQKGRKEETNGQAATD